MKKLIFILALILAASTVEAGPFAPKQKTYKTNSFKKHKPNKKDAFACTRTKRLTRKGTLK